MRQLFARLWKDDAGALIASEFLFVATILVTGITVGLTTVRNAVTSEMAEFSNSVLALNQGYTVNGQLGCCSFVLGSAAIDTPQLVVPPVCTVPPVASLVSELPSQ